MGSMDGHVALISGGARGMGAAEAALFVAEGAQVIIGDVLDEEGAATAAGLGDACQYVHLDVTSADDWAAAVAAAEAAYGPVSALVNNAGIVEWGTIEATTPETFRRVLEINLVGVFLGMHTTIPSMRRAGGGAIVNISSTAGMMGYSLISAYVASKWGVRGLTKTAALELAADGIRVNSVHPGPIATPMTAGLDAGMTATQPIPRFGTVEEVAALVRFLVVEATFTTGAEFVIDGGAIVGQGLTPPE
jgi:3alpha(or 20beta)-hydroxysteroid dehydrogenase